MKQSIEKLDIWSLLNKVNQCQEIEWDENIEKLYDSFLINKAFSQHPDTILYSNDMNIHFDIPKKIQYLYYINSIRPKKRYSKWAKKDKASERQQKIDLIKEYFKYNDRKALNVLSILSEDDFIMIQKKLETGGIK
jgi:hypothetical protein